MPRTPDRHPGAREEEAVIFDKIASDPSTEQEVSFVEDKGMQVFSDGSPRAIGEGRSAHHQKPVDDRDVDDPPGSPSTGYRVIVGVAPTGAFVGHAFEIAEYTGSAWVFTTPLHGMVVYVKDEAEWYKQYSASSPWSWRHHVDIQNIGSHGIAADKIAVTDGSGGVTMQDAPAPSFGAWYKEEQDEDEIGTTSGTWQDALELTFPSDLAEGDYVIMCALVCSGSSSSTQIGLRQLFDTGTVCEIVVQATGTAVDVPLSNFHVQKTISGSHTFKIQYRKDGGSGTAYVKNRIIITFRVA